jgi:hypothetical protein
MILFYKKIEKFIITKKKFFLLKKKFDVLKKKRIDSFNKKKII